MIDFITPISSYLLPASLVVLFCIFSFCSFFYERIKKSFTSALVWKFIAVCILLRIVNSLFFTYLQYKAWAQSGATSYLLLAPLSADAPIQGIKYLLFFFGGTSGYFYFYSFSRFWFALVLTLFSGLIFYGFLKMLKKKTARFFDEGEVEMGLLSALLVGWPMFVIFIPLVFISTVLISLYRSFVLKERYTTLGIPFFVATLVTFILGGIFLSIFGLSVLKI